MSLLAEMSIFPMDKGPSVSPYVARMVQIIRDSGLDYRLHAMGTTLEGSWAEVMEVVDNCFKDLEQDCDRIYMVLKLDYKKQEQGQLEHKVQAVEERIQS